MSMSHFAHIHVSSSHRRKASEKPDEVSLFLDIFGNMQDEEIDTLNMKLELAAG